MPVGRLVSDDWPDIRHRRHEGAKAFAVGARLGGERELGDPREQPVLSERQAEVLPVPEGGDEPGEVVPSPAEDETGATPISRCVERDTLLAQSVSDPQKVLATP